MKILFLFFLNLSEVESIHSRIHHYNSRREIDVTWFGEKREIIPTIDILFADKDTKKSKNDKKVQNGDVNQKKQKDRKLKKTNKGFIAKGKNLQSQSLCLPVAFVVIFQK